jgi:hypothetical protein
MSDPERNPRLELPEAITDARTAQAVDSAESAIAQMGTLLGLRLPSEDLPTLRRSLERQAIDLAPVLDFVERAAATPELFTPRW